MGCLTWLIEWLVIDILIGVVWDGLGSFFSRRPNKPNRRK